jgi:hypothetical protein
MATLYARVNIGTALVPNTLVNQRRFFVYSGTSISNGSFGNIPRKVSRSQYAYNINNPSIAGAITVSGAGPTFFSSEDLTGQTVLVGSLAGHIEAGYITIEDTAAPGVPLNRAALEAYL